MPRIGLSLRQGNNVKNNASSSPPSPPSVTLYRDNFISWGSQDALFTERQWFSSGQSNTVLYGSAAGNKIYQATGATGRQLLVHFDCNKEQYPLYDNGFMYAGGGQTVYGGIYGHGLFKSVSYRASGYPPIYSAPTNTIDANGWLRTRPDAPPLRTIQEGQSLRIAFRLDLAYTTPTFGASSNAFRIGLFKSTGDFINTDSVGPVDARFASYTGYMIGIGLNHRILKRIQGSSTNLIASGGAFTQLATSPMTFSTLMPSLYVELKVSKSSGLTYIDSLVTGFNGNGNVTNSAQVTVADTADTLSFDTLCLYAGSNMMDAFTVSDFTAILS